MWQQLCQVSRRNGDTHWQKAESIEAWLQYMEEDLVDVIWEEQKKSNLEPIKRFSTHLKSNDVVLTFNYDTLIEQSLEQQNIKFNYGFNTINSYGVKILKTHGSINWIMVPREQKDNFGYPLLFEKTDLNVNNHGAEAPNEIEYKWVLLQIPDKSLNSRIENRALQLGNKKFEISSSISGLGRYKPLSKMVGSGEIWKNSFNAIHNCEKIYIIGFSLSPFDTMARLNFGGVMMERNQKNVGSPLINLIDPYASKLEPNFRSVFGCSIKVIEKKGEELDWATLLKET